MCFLNIFDKNMHVGALKKSLILLTLSNVLFVLCMSGQPNDTLRHTRWVNYYMEYDLNFQTVHESYVKYCTTDEDTLMGGLPYLKLFDCGVVPWMYRGGLRVQGDQWFFWSRDSLHEMMLYDFGLNEGDSLLVPLYSERSTSSDSGWHVSGVSYPNYHGKIRKQIDLVGIGHFGWMTIIEGIGSIEGILWGPFNSISGQITELACFSQRDTTYFTGMGFSGSTLNQACATNMRLRNPDKYLSVQAFPNPNQGTFTLQLSDYSGPVQLSVYTLCGQRVWEGEVFQLKSTLDVALPAGQYVLHYQSALQAGGLPITVQ
jgi:hypothetical protein